jgi:hypothetical protein
MLFNLPLDLDLVGSWRAWSRIDGGLQALGHEPPSHANDGREADIQSLDDLLISAAGSARRFVAQEQDPRMDQLSCRGLARGHHPIQCLTLLDGQGHLVLLHRGTPSLGPESSHGLKESRSHLTCQLKMDGTLVSSHCLAIVVVHTIPLWPSGCGSKAVNHGLEDASG